MITQTGTSFLDFKRATDVASFPEDFARYQQSFGQVYYWEKGKFHVVTKAELAREVLTSSAYSADRGGFFISRMPEMDLSLIQDFFGVVRRMMVMSDDQDHLQKRKLASGGFEDHILERFTSTVQKTVVELVSSVKGQKEVEFVEIAKRLPSRVLADLFSIPESDRENFFVSSNIMTGFFGGASQYRNEDGIEVNRAARSLVDYFSRLIIERRETPGEDYVSILLKAQKEMRMSDQDLVAQLIMMLVAGQVTTTDQINNIMFILAHQEGLQEEIRRHPELLVGALEELKRIDPAVSFIFRVARAETMLGAQPIKPGDVIFVATHAINRDLPQEELPHVINIHRKGTHFAYGHGPHYCLGAKLGRLEMRLLFEEIFKSLPTFRLKPDKSSTRDHYSLSFSGFKELHLEFV